MKPKLNRSAPSSPHCRRCEGSGCGAPEPDEVRRLAGSVASRRSPTMHSRVTPPASHPASPPYSKTSNAAATNQTTWLVLPVKLAFQ